MDDLKNIIKYSKNLKLLYVEDNKEARESTQSILKEFFNIVIIAVDGEDGLKKFQSNEINLIITDINMPKLNGLDMIEKIKKIDIDVSIIILSAYNESIYFIDSIKYGTDGYLLKPIVMEQFLGVLKKIIDKFQLKEEAKNNLHLLKQYQEATNSSSIVSKANTSGIITYINDNFCKISGYSPNELIGKSHNIIRHPDNSNSFYNKMWNIIKNKKQIWKGIIRNKSKNGNSFYVNCTIKPILDSKNNIIEYIALNNDITDIMNPRKQLQDLIDSTPNAIAVMIKIEHFEDIENFYYQKIAQKIEDKFATILTEKIPKEYGFEKVFQIGNGEYIFAKNRDTCELSIDTMVLKLKEFQHDMNKINIDIGDIDYNISIIISFSYGQNVLESIKYSIKKLAKTNQDFIVTNGLTINEQNNAKHNIDTLKKVKKAINDFKIICYFQPIIDNKTLEIKKYESLVRLIDEDGEILSPFYFLDIAKKGKYYSQITAIVLTNSFKALKSTNMDISINISALDIEKKETRDKLYELLEQNKHEASRVVLELLEDEDVKDFNTITKFIKNVKEFGVKIAIDDFGAGYSNFKRLLNYQPDILKIDSSLIKNIAKDSFSLNIVETIVAFAQKQHIQTIAEYVENEQIFNILCSIGVDYSQGYYFSEPVPLNLL